MTEKDKIIIYKYARDQWLVMAILSCLIGGAFFVFQFLPLFDVSWSLGTQFGLYFIIVLIEFGLVCEWYNSNSNGVWGRSFDSAIERAVVNNTHFSVKDIKQRTLLLQSATLLSVICFFIGFICQSSHHWLSLFVPVFASVLGNGSIEEVANKSTLKSKLSFIPVSLVFAFIFGISWRFTDSSLPEYLKYILTYGAWVSNGILGAFVMYITQRIISFKRT
ncbi:hypothetical protein ABRZ58_22300 [Vibrio vulnificus]|uniref:hypothetical protein n=1 Tax=Vibrio vulnificus TaxID=672 RepID=UPI0032EAA4CD